MPSRPSVSVVVAAMNVEPHIGIGLQSLRRQGIDPDDLEVIVVDDGSTDRTGDVIDEMVRLIPRATVIHNGTNFGVSHTRNQGLERATGRYITFLDGDDWYAPGHLAHMRRVLDTVDVDFVKSDFVEVRGRARTLVRMPVGRRDVPLDPRDHILPDHGSTMIDFPHCWSGMYRSEMAEAGLLEFDSGLATAEDRPWIWRMFYRTRAMAVTSGPGVMYRRNIGTSLTQVLDDRQMDFCPAFDQVITLLENEDVDPDIWGKLARNWLAVLAHQVKRSHKADADYRARLTERARATSRRIPEQYLQRGLEKFGKQRASFVHEVLGDFMTSHHFRHVKKR
ncbi:glycosyltransferase family 2 protein [Brevibacterium litoralis]|uniref:glycosyltransferase family 2 protein n=1 Tax=Brevibacterium litoralis TaxID=3138935 RepID=UPI0032EE5D75